MSLYNARILGTGMAVPEKIMTNEDMSKFVDTTHEWIVERTGIHERRVADKSKGEYPSYFAEIAGKQAIKNAGLQPNDIELILFSITVPDYLMPNTASVLQDRLGITNQCPCLDINAACSGWVYGMTVANSLIQTGVYKNILLVACETTSLFNNFKDRSYCVLFGDACGAAVLGRSEAGQSSKVLSSHLGNDSSKKESLLLPFGGARQAVTKDIIDQNGEFLALQFNGQEIYKSAVKNMTASSAIVLEKAGLTKETVDWFVPHQANLRIIEAVGQRLEFPTEKTVINVDKYANSSSATIPVALHEAITDGRIKRGDKVLIAALGGGLTYGAMTLEY